MIDYKYPIYKPYFSGLEKDYVLRALNSGWISSKGEYIAKFEDIFARYVGAKFSTSVSNGTTALHLALLSLGIGQEDEVIVPSFTYVASVNCIKYVNAIPVFIDSLEDTLQMDPDKIETKVTPKTKAILVPHLYGMPCDMDKIMSISKKYNLLVIEDCAEAFGTLYKGKHVGAFGDVSTFSFFGNKTITTGEGGMLISNSKEVIELAAHLKSQGVSKDREYYHDVVAYNYRMTNICAAIGLAQLEKADHILKKKREIAFGYKDKLSNLPLRFHDELPNTHHSFWMCTILLNDPQERSRLREHLQQHGVETRPLFPPCHQLPHLYSSEHFSVAESISARGINLPSYPNLETKEVEYIASSIIRFFR